MSRTNDVIHRHLQSFLARDLEGILADYAPDAVFFTEGGTLRGPTEIRGLFTPMLEEFGKPGATFTLQQQHVEGDHAYILWTAQTADNHYELATDTFLVQNGKIAVQSFASKITPRH